jgi:hypothetical protein
MKQYKFTGLFRAYNGHEYELTTSCNGFLQAFFLLTADAIKGARHYQLATITNELGDVRQIGDILECSKLIK